MASTITIKNIPDDIYFEIKKLADLHHRSINSEVITIFKKTTKSQKFDHQKYLENAGRIRKILQDKGVYLTQIELDQAKNYGRS